ncbi:Pisatin demethylase [Podospora aff. communis PSN243]|uniref:Pisatin demethylase n=1 Tax=Podospora aff. communis PSN243 TaxID=3040156 RepID=A0AAV9G652_9PEZI|nr:Pisatin demethylase [Podospora aff. communis PSN243]
MANTLLEACASYASPSSILGLVLVALLTAIIKRRYFSPLSDIPGPFLASITRFWQIRTLLQGDSVNVIYDLHEKHGPFVRIAPNEISVCHRDAPKKLLLTPLHKDNWYRAGAIPDYRFETTLSITSPKAKVARSRHLLQGYSTTSLLRQEDRMDAIFSQLLDWLDKFSSTNDAMDLDRFFTFAAADLNGQVLFSKPFGFLAEGKDIDDTLARSHSIAGIGTVAGYFPWLNKLVANPFVTWLGVLPFKLIFDTGMKAISERQGQPDKAKNKDILGQWLQAHEDGKLTLRNVQAQTTLGVSAGTDAMSTGFQSFAYYTMRHPAAWKRCRVEVLQSQREHGRCKGKVVSFADAQTLPYLQACIKESLRLFGPLGTGLPRVVGEGGTKIGERVFPAGTTLSIHPYSMMRDKNIWGPDANEFKPERWLDEKVSAELDHFWMPFGLGYAACPGINLAKTELSKVAASIVRDYDIRPVDPRQEWSYEAYFNALPHTWPVYVAKAANE